MFKQIQLDEKQHHLQAILWRDTETEKNKRIQNDYGYVRIGEFPGIWQLDG